MTYGMMEYWDVGILGNERKIEKYFHLYSHYSILPFFQYSSGFLTTDNGQRPY